MIFNSIPFICFFVTVVFVLQLANRFTAKPFIRNILLLAASYYFYGSFSWTFLLLLLYVTALTYCFGIVLDKEGVTKRKSIITANIILTILPLLFYKYFEFLLSNIDSVFSTNYTDGLGKIVLPVGISFFTFQALSYTLDIYRKKIHAITNPIDVALFVSFFPTILSGPIERGRNLLPQIAENRKITLEQIVSGITLFAWGVFKKVVVADRLGQYVDWAYGSAEYQTGTTLGVAAVLYSFQIYCDFSGYSDMAIGVARCMGFNIMKNFKYPYFAHTMKEFWRRWHISLTSWFTEYVYFSLGGSRVKTRIRWAFNISMVFLLSGIWHGAAWNFLLWGGMHALLYLVEYKVGLQKPEIENRWKIPRLILVFFMATLAWIFFRVEDMNRAYMIVEKIVTHPLGVPSLGASAFGTALSFLLLCVCVVLDFVLYRNKINLDDSNRSLTLKNLTFLVVLLLGISLFSVSSDNFVYFQF